MYNLLSVHLKRSFWKKEVFAYIFRKYCKNIAANESLKQFKQKIADGPALNDFVTNENISCGNSTVKLNAEKIPYLWNLNTENHNQKVYIETYGCQMNVNDTEIIYAILEKEGFKICKDISDADVIFIMTCSIRDGAEQKIWRRLESLRALKKKRSRRKVPLRIGIVGCMAERLKNELIEKEKIVDIVAGPDSYRDLPNLLSLANKGQKAVNVMLSVDETYADIIPVRTDPQTKTAFVSIMRGCDNMCSYCIVPFTRGQERSRPVSSIVDEVRHLSDQGYKEVTLLGQNVNSYRDISEPVVKTESLSKGFRTLYKKSGGLRFDDLLERVADVNPEMRIRFTSPHPKDFPDEVLHVIKERNNVCKLLHLPAQSGNSQVLMFMKRGYTREAYLELVEHIRNVVPDVAFTSDFICGFFGETEEAHKDTLTLMEKVKYEYVFVFPYSKRKKTFAYHRLKDDIPEEVKKERAKEIADLFRAHALERHKKEIGKEHLVLVSGVSKRSEYEWAGRNDWNTKVIFPYFGISIAEGSSTLRYPAVGDYVVVKVSDCSSQVLKGEAMYHTTLQEFYQNKKNKENDFIQNFVT